jgi:hypothetical protein
MSINKMYAEKVGSMYADRVGSGSGVSSGKSSEIPDQPDSELQKRGFEINALYHQANDLRIRVRQIADSVYGDEMEKVDNASDQPTAQIDMVGSLHGLTFEIGQLEQAMAELRGQVSRLQNL